MHAFEPLRTSACSRPGDARFLIEPVHYRERNEVGKPTVLVCVPSREFPSQIGRELCVAIHDVRSKDSVERGLGRKTSAETLHGLIEVGRMACAQLRLQTNVAYRGR